MSAHLTRRSLIQAAALAATPAWPMLASAQERRFEPQVGAWRTFEITTTVNVADVKGASRVWLPVPAVDSDWQKPLGDTFQGNASKAEVVAAANGVRMLHAEFAASEPAPTVTLVSRVQTRSRAVDWSRKGAAVAEDPAVLRAALAPSELKPLDGIVLKTAQQATRGASTELDKVRALYDWVVANGFREPKTRGCGTGDIKTMLETGNLGGKCADLNAIFVGLCRAAGIPARDVYGVRLAPSAFGYRELGGNSTNLKGAQHCRAEVYLKDHGWVGMDPADVLKVMRMETSDWIRDPKHPLVAPVYKGLYGGWEGNWVGWNRASDVPLPGSSLKGTLPFFMYPNGENSGGRFDEVAADSFKYTIAAREIA